MAKPKHKPLTEEELELCTAHSHDYYETLDDAIPDNNLIKSFKEWERLFYKVYYPNRKPTLKMYLTFIVWHDRFLIYRYSK
jgi:hypothetical protein